MRYREVDDKPPFEARNQREREWMREWINSRLDDLMEQMGDKWGDHLLWDRVAEDYEPVTNKDAIAAAAIAGDVEPLRQFLQREFPDHPQLAELIRPPKLVGQGKRYSKKAKVPLNTDDPRWQLVLAIYELGLIRQILEEHYEESRRVDQLSAYEIVADRWDVDEDRVRKWGISRSFPRPPTERTSPGESLPHAEDGIEVDHTDRFTIYRFRKN